SCYCAVCFFFQAEDGIRDFHVTGVQTCALPIYHLRVVALEDIAHGEEVAERLRHLLVVHAHEAVVHPVVHELRAARALGLRDLRSEERRVGKECRSQWLSYDEKRKT